MFNVYHEFESRQNDWLHNSKYHIENNLNDHAKEELFAQIAQLNSQKLFAYSKTENTDFDARAPISTLSKVVTTAKFAALNSLCNLYDKLS